MADSTDLVTFENPESLVLRDRMVPLLLDACPSFRQPWALYQADASYDPDLYYVHLGEFAMHLIDLLRTSNVSEFESVFLVVEDFHVRGEPFVKEAATIGLFESIQNASASYGVPPDTFRQYLLPTSLTWWDRLNRFWEGDQTALRRDA